MLLEMTEFWRPTRLSKRRTTRFLPRPESTHELRVEKSMLYLQFPLTGLTHGLACLVSVLHRYPPLLLFDYHCINLSSRDFGDLHPPWLWIPRPHSQTIRLWSISPGTLALTYTLEGGQHACAHIHATKKAYIHIKRKHGNSSLGLYLHRIGEVVVMQVFLKESTKSWQTMRETLYVRFRLLPIAMT